MWREVFPEEEVLMLGCKGEAEGSMDGAGWGWGVRVTDPRTGRGDNAPILSPPVSITGQQPFLPEASHLRLALFMGFRVLGLLLLQPLPRFLK